MLDTFRRLHKTFIRWTGMGYERGKWLVITIELVVLISVVSILAWRLPYSFEENLLIIFLVPFLATVVVARSGRVDSQEVTHDPMSVIEDALNKPQLDGEDTQRINMAPFLQDKYPESETQQPETPQTEAAEPARSKWRRTTVRTVHPDKSVRIRRGLFRGLGAGEKIELAQRLHYSMLLPAAVVTVGAFAAIFYIRKQPQTAWYWMVAMVMAFAVIVGLPIYRQILRLKEVTRRRHIIIGVSVVVIPSIVFRAFLPDLGLWVIHAIWWLMRALQLDNISLETVMWLIFWISLVQFGLRALVWWLNPIVVTNQQLIETKNLVVPAFPGVFLVHLTDVTPRPYLFFRWAETLVVETPGQEQSITRIPWFPVRLHKWIRAGTSANN